MVCNLVRGIYAPLEFSDSNFNFRSMDKLLIRHNFYYGEIRPVVDGFFNLVYVRNDGAAWNILSGQVGY